MPAFNKFQPFVANLANAGLNLGSDTIKAFLSNAAPTNTHGTYSQESANDLTTGGGYTNGGGTVTITGSTQSGGTYTLAATGGYTWTGTGSGFGPFRYVILYDSTSGNLIGWWDYGSSISVPSGGTFAISFASGILTLS